MNEKQPYEKHLADKLESLPPPGDSHQNWPAMKALLDQQMPATGGHRPGGGSWWTYGIIVAVLIVGTWVYTRNEKDQSTELAKTSVADQSENQASKPEAVGAASTQSNNTKSIGSNNNEENSTLERTDQINPEQRSTEKAAVPSSGSSTQSPLIDGETKKTETTPDEKVAKTSELRENKIVEKVVIDKADTNTEISKSTNTSKLVSKQGDYLSKKQKSSRNSTVEKEESVYTFNNSTTKRKGKKLGAGKMEKKGNEEKNSSTENTAIANTEKEIKSTSLLFGADNDWKLVNDKQLLQPDSIAEDYSKLVKPTELLAKSRFKQRTDRTRALKNRIVGTGEQKNFVIGLTLPLTMPLSNQRVLAYNVNGGANTVSDYIPSPNVQYHLSQSTYLQAELQIASPQHIQPVLLSQAKSEISGPQGSYRYISKSIFAKKLYYFNLPVGINYSPFKNFYLGTGLQFSSLMSGIGFSETRGSSGFGPGSRDTLFNSGYFKFRNDTLSGRLNNNEVRLTLDANYYWKKFTLGMRYNQALNNYVSLQVIPNTPVFTDRNKALQIYLRYNLWEDKKKKRPASMASR